MAIDNKLAAVIMIEDPIRKEVPDVVHSLRELGVKKIVMMTGDGEKSAADVGIAISDGAELAREIADITISGNDLYTIVNLKKISNGLMKRIKENYRSIVGINTALIALGVSGILMPTTSALLHNTSTLAISLKSMENILEKE